VVWVWCDYWLGFVYILGYCIFYTLL